MTQKITNHDQKCISECIFEHWNESSETPHEERADKYEQCLTDCKICS